MSKYLVVGAGISGASIAGLIAQGGDDKVLVIDRANTVGGNCFDFVDGNGITVHRYGSHIFHTSNKDVWDFLNRFTTFRPYRHKVRVAIGNQTVPLPFNLESLHRCFPAETASELEEILLRTYGYGTTISIRDLMSSTDTKIHMLAQYVYDHVFLGYTCKQWGKDPSQIDESVLSRVPISISNEDGYFRDVFQGIPEHGYTAMISRMLDAPNIEVRLNTTIDDVEVSEFDRVFFTGSVDELMGYSLGPLPYRSVRQAFETVDTVEFQGTAVVNYPDAPGFTRIHEYKHYLEEDSPVTTISREYPEEYVPGTNIPSYPISSMENESLYRQYVGLAKTKYPNMRFLGRLGDYRYYDMDDAVARAITIYKEVFE